MCLSIYLYADSTSSRRFQRERGALPYVGQYHLPVLWPPFFYANLTPNDSIFHYSSHLMTLFSKFLNVKFQIFRVIFMHFQTFCQFQLKKANFHSNLHGITPYFGKFTPEKAEFFGIPHPMSQWPPFFYKIVHRMPPFFVGTYLSLSYLSAPLPGVSDLVWDSG